MRLIQRCRDPLKSVKHAGLQRLIMALLDLMVVCNSKLWEEEVDHFCRGASCCLPPSPDVTPRQVAQKRVYVAVKATVFPQVPATPAVNKWTKLAPVCDLLILGLLMHGIFPRVFATLQVASSGAAADIDMSMDFDMIRDVFFSAVAGSRFKAALRFLSDPATCPALVTLGLVLEPLRVITSWFMRRAREVELYHSCKCPLMDVLHKPTSVIYAALQYL